MESFPVRRVESPKGRLRRIKPVDLHALKFRGNLRRAYPDIYTPAVLDALAALAPLNEPRRDLMSDRIQRRGAQYREGRRLAFLNPLRTIPGTPLNVQDVRDGKFIGGDIPADLRRQWIQGTGPATRPELPVSESIRSVAYALLSGADGWMFDGEDALGQLGTMSLDNQRNLKLAFANDPVFLEAAEDVATEMNEWSKGFLGRAIIPDWRRQLDFTTRLFRPRGLHLDDRHIRTAGRAGLSASIVDLVLYVVNNHETLKKRDSTIALYIPKIQTAEEAAFWSRMMRELEEHLSLRANSIRCYVLVEQLEAAFQLMEIRAAMGPRFLGFNTGRWDYINSVADDMAWDPEFVHPNVDAITMTWGYMRAYEDRVRRAVATKDVEGRAALWQGGMEANIPVGSPEGVARSMKRAVEGAERERKEGASGKWVSHWKMVHVLRPVWEKAGDDNQLKRRHEPLTHTPEDADALLRLEPGPRTIRGAREIVSIALQYALEFAQGRQAAALKPADAVENEDVLFLMEDLATAEIRMSVLWEWVHKRAEITETDEALALAAGDRFDEELFDRILREESAKIETLLDSRRHGSDRSPLPVAREVVQKYVAADVKIPWFVDLLNLNLENHDVKKARRRIAQYLDLLKTGHRITENPDFGPSSPAEHA
jgi:malate synthase